MSRIRSAGLPKQITHMSQELKKVIKLVKKTGDRIIVFDPDEGEENFVVLPWEEYERLLSNSGFIAQNQFSGEEVKNLTENELIDKINRDIAAWKTENEDKKLDSYKIIESVLESEPEEEVEPEEDNFYYYNEPEDRQEQSRSEKPSQTEPEDEPGKEKRRAWDIPVDIKKGAEEVK